MQYNRVVRILALTLIFSLLMLALPVIPALAAGITLTPNSGPVGTVITITGSGFTASTSGWIWFDSNGDGVKDVTEPQVAVTTTATGAIPSGIMLMVPSVTADNYYPVQADIPTGLSIEVQASFLVTARSITLNPTSGYVGDTVIINGTGFAASVGITILFDTTSVKTATTSGGAFTTTFFVPNACRGSHTVKAQETSAPNNYATAVFSVLSKLTITPTIGAVGDRIIVYGTGFAANSSVTIFFDTTIIDATTTDVTGSFTSTNLTIPLASRGNHTIRAQDLSTNYATATFTVGQSITITPTSGTPGTNVTINGTGFAVSRTVTIKYNAAIVTTTPTTVITDARGSFTASFTVPTGTAGTYPVEASDGISSASTNFTVTINITLNTVTSSTSPGHVGMEITINGTGFMPNSPITITYASETTTYTTTSLADGSFSYTFDIPPSAGGAHTITASDGTNSLQTTFYMESVAPASPELLLPLSGESSKSMAVLDWGDVTTDINDAVELSRPLTYDLQIAFDTNFTNILVEKTGLTISGYTLLKTEKLESTEKEAPYHWRVRAIDAASNVSDWTSSTFYVSSNWTTLYYYLIGGAGVILAFFLGFFIGRIRKRSS